MGDLSSLIALDIRNNALTGSIPAELADLSSLTGLWLTGNSLTGCIPVSLQGFVSTINPQRDGVNLPLCPVVPVLTLTAGDAEIDASWTVPAGGTPTGYDLEYKLSSDATWTDAGHSGTGTTATIGSLANGSTYDVRVRAKTATDTGAWSATASATPGTAPRLTAGSVDNANYVLNTLIKHKTLPVATGGDGELVYTLSPNPPAGLTFDAATRTLTGTPTAVQSQTTYTYKVADSDADTTATDATSVQFTITVAATHGCAGSTAVGGSAVTSGGLVDDCETMLRLQPTLEGQQGSLRWGTDVAMASWNGVTLANGRVDRLEIVERPHLSGTISAEVAKLSHLTVLKLRLLALGKLSEHKGKGLRGPIPPELGNLTRLEQLDLYYNDLTGPIPPELGNLTNLTVLNLQANYLTGSIPPELGNLTSLTYLSLGENLDLTGSIPPELGNLSSLETLNLYWTGLTGIPPELGNLSNLTRLHIFFTPLTGSIPPELGNLSSLEFLELSNTDLTGSIPPELGNLSSLTQFHLVDNDLTGSIPPELGKLSSSLTEFHVFGNSLTGCVPRSLNPFLEDELFGINPQQGNVSLSLCVASTGVTLSVSPSSVAEDADSAVVTVTARLNGDVLSEDTTVTVTVGATGDGAVEGTDYATVSNLAVPIARFSGSGTATFTLDPTDDGLAEGDETLSVSGTVTGLTVTGTTVTIADDDVAVRLSVNPSSVAEDADSAAVVTVTATLNVSAFSADTTVTVAVGATSDGASEGTDYTAVNDFTLTIPGGSTTVAATFTLDPTDDKVAEGDETLSVSGTVTGGLVVGSTEVTITDDDQVSTSATLSVDPSSVAEDITGGIATMTVTATLNQGAFSEDKLVTVTVGHEDDGASGGDYYAEDASFTVTISAGATSGTGTFGLELEDDAAVEGDETFTVLGTVPGLTVTGTTVTITDDDAAVTLSVEPSSVAEDTASAATVTVTAAMDAGTRIAATAVTVAVGAAADGATEGTDYTAVNDFTVTIPADSASATATFTLDPTDDALAEGDETLSVSGSATEVTVTGTTVTIDDDETESTGVTLSVNPTSAAENADSVVLTVIGTLDEDAFTSNKTVTVAVGASSDGATEGTDYATVSDVTLTIVAGNTADTATFTLKPTDDGLAEGDETLSVSGTSTGLTVTGTTVTIDDDETASTGVTLSVNPNSVAENADSAVVTVIGTLDEDAFTEDKTVTVAVGASSDGATEGTDYATVSDVTLTLVAGNTADTATFTVKPADDVLAEGDETFSVSGTSSGLTVTGTTVTISDNETASTGVTLSVDPSSVDENADSAVVTVIGTLDEDAFTANKTVTVAVGASSDAAVEGTDYATVSDVTLTIVAGNTADTATFTLKPTDDVLAEGDETLSVSGTSTDLTVTGTTVTIDDDETASTGVTLSVNPTSVAENADSAVVTVIGTLDEDAFTSNKTVTVAVGAASDGATEGTDYATVSDVTLTIAAGNTADTATFTVKPTDDALAEGDETLSVSGTSTGLTVTGTTVTISDDETASTGVTLSVNPTSVAENADSAVVTVIGTLDEDAFPSNKTVTVAVGASSDAAVEGTDYATVADLTLTIAAGNTADTATFTLKPSDDGLAEGDETFSVSGTVTGLTVTGTTVTISDDDTESTGVTLSVDPSSVDEDADSAVVTVIGTLDEDAFTANKSVTVAVGASTDGATEGTDYATVADLTLTIAAGNTADTATFTLKPADDVLAEGDETFSVSGTATGLTVTGTTVTISDNETASTGVTLSVDPSSVDEDADSAVVTVIGTLDEDAFTSNKTVTVAVGAASDAAVEGTDYATVSDVTLTIAAGNTADTATFTLKPTDDALAEGDETLSVSGTSTGLTVTGTTVTISDDETASTGVTLSVSPTSVAENADSAVVTVIGTLDEDAFTSNKTVTVAVGATSDGATEGTDYATVADVTLTIAAGNTADTATFTLKPTDDALAEGDETFSVSGTSSGLTVTGTTVTISDNETASTGVTLSVNPTSVAENADSAVVTVIGTLDEDAFTSNKSVTVAVGASTDAATEGTDYATVADLTLTIAAGNTADTATFTLKPTDDALAEGDETLSVSGTATGLTVTGTTVTIDDNETASTGVTLSVNPDSVAENADSAVVTVIGTLDEDAFTSNKSVTVAVGASTDGAIEGTDYATVADLTLTIAAGNTADTATFTLKPTDDVLAEGDETLSVSGTSTGLTVTGTTVTLDDNETESTTVTVSMNPSSVAEDADSVVVTVYARLDHDAFPVDKTVRVTIGAPDELLPEDAVPGTDHEVVSDTVKLTIAAGNTAGTATFTLKPIDDDVAEWTEFIFVSANADDLGAVTSSMHLTDDEPRPTATLALSPASISENGDSTVVTATLSGVSSETTTLVVSATAASPAVGADFTLSANHTLTIAAGSTTSAGKVSIKAVNNAVDAPNKSVTVSATASGGTGVANPSDQTLTITDDEATPTVSLALSPASIGENGDSTVVTATLSAVSSEKVTLIVSAAAVSPAVGADFTLSANDTLTIAAGSTTSTGKVSIKAVNNAVDAPNKSVTVSAIASGGNGVANPSDQTLTITDDDGTPTVALALSPASIGENGDSTVVTATLSGVSSEKVTLVVSAAAVSPAVGADFTLSANDTLTIAAGATTSTGKVSIKAVNNAVDAPNKSVTVSATASGGNGVANPADKTLTITDDEATPTVSLALSPASISENGDSTVVTATLSGTSSAAVTVTVSAAAVSPAVAGDFTLSTNKTLSIAAGATTSTGTVTIKAVNNSVDAPDKSVTVSATASGGRGVAHPSDQTLTITDDEATPTVTLVLTPASVSENGDSTVVTATLSGASSEKVTLIVSAAAVSPAVGADFTLSANDTLTIAAGSTTSTGTVTIKAVNNAVDAPDKSVTVSATASGGNGVAKPSDQTLTITDDEATPTVSLALSPLSIGENGDSTVVTATLSAVSSAKVTLIVSAAAVSPAVGADFTLSANDTLTIAAGSTTSTGKVSIKAVNNAVDAPNKSVTVSATASGGNGVANPSDQTLTITDDDGTPTVALALSPASIGENGDSTVVTATLSGASSEKVTLVVSVAAVSPAVGADFTLSANDTLTIAAGATTSTGKVAIKAVNNAVDAPNKSVTVSATASGGNGVANPADKTLTITDDEATPTVSLALSPASVSENGDSTVVTATLSAVSSEKVTLIVSAAAVSPAVGADFTLSANDTLTIAAGSTTSTGKVAIKAVNNAVDAPNKSVTVSATASGGNGVANPADKTLTITDDEATPTVSLALSPASVSENGDSTVVTATLSAVSSEKVTLIVSAGAVSPAVGADFTLSANDTLTIAAGATTSTGKVSIKAVNNAVDAPNKSVTVSATASGGNGVANPSDQTLTITDDDATPTVTLALNPSSIGENGDSTVVTATLSAVSSEKVTLVVSAAAVSPAVGADFTLSANDTLTIAAGSTTSTGTVAIKAVNNAVDAPDKSVTVSATASGGNGVANPSDQTLAITDDDATPTVTLALNPTSIGENGDSTVVTATLSAVSSEKVTLIVSPAAVSPAVAGDFTVSTNKTLTIAAGATTSTGTVTVKAVNNSVDAPDKSVTVSATASGGNGVANPSDQTLTITDNDATPTVTLVLTPASVSENGDSTVVTATLSGASSEKVTLIVSAAAVSPAVGADFTLSANDTLTIAAGATTSTGTVTIKAVNNAIDAPNKSVTVSAAASGGRGVSNPSDKTLTITDDDATPTVSLVLSPASISENGDSTVVTAKLSGASSEKVTLIVSAAAVSPTVAGDFTASANDTLTIAAGATTSTGTVTIKAVNNSVDAPDKSVTVSATASGGNAVANPSDQTLAITDDDGTPTLSLVLTPSSIGENGDSTVVTATLSGTSSEKVTLVVSVAAVSPAVAGDFTLSTNKTLSIAAGATTSTGTVTIKAVNNAVDAPNKSVTVTATASGGNGVPNPADRTLTITDDETTPTVTLALSPSSIGENGDSTVVTATLSGPSTEKVTLVVSAAAVSPAVGADFTLSTNDTLTIAAGETSSTGTVKVKAVNNAIDAPDKSVTVSATASGGRGVANPSDQTLTITDDEATPTVTLALSPSSIGENGDSTVVTATLSAVSSEKVTLIVSAAAVSPAVAADFTLSANDTLTIAAGSTTSTGTVTIKAVNNAVDAPNKSVTVSATASGGNGVADPSDQTLAITDDDGTPTVTLALSPASIGENGDSTVVTATLSGASSEKMTLIVSAAAVSPAVAGDLTLSANDTLTIAAGATTSTGTVTIKAVNNAVDAPDKSVTVSATASGGNGVANPANKTLTITDDETTPTVTLALSSASISENGDSTVVTATLSGASSERVTLVVSAAAVSPAVAGDFALSTNKTLTIGAGATTSTGTVKIKAVNNAVDAPDKSVTVSATASGGNGVANPSDQTLAITDDEATPTVSLVLSPASISENGDSTVVTATLSGASSEAVTVTTMSRIDLNGFI